MNPVFQCPKCREKIKQDFSCPHCLRSYFDKEGFFDFIDNLVNTTKNADKKILDLLSNISSYGYSDGLQQFLRKNPEFEYRFNKMEGSIAFRAIKKNNIRCLVINSDLGNISENLSHVFDEVYSMEDIKEKILIQNKRFQKNNIDNVILIRSDTKHLPFPDKHFDLVVSNGIRISRTNNESPKSEIYEYLDEIKRVLMPEGCLCIGAKNQHGLKIFGNDITDDNAVFSDSFSGYTSLLNSCGFSVKSFWVFPSYQKPHYSANLEDNISLNWFFKNFDKKFSVDRRFKILGLFLKMIDSSARKLIVKMFSPSFLFYCYGKEVPGSLEEIIVEQTGFKNFVQNVRLTKIMYILLDRAGNPEKVISCKLAKYDLTEKIVFVKRIFPNMGDPDEKIILDQWLTGEVLDRLDSNDIVLAMNWLVDFQHKTTSELLSEQEVDDEITCLEKEMSRIDAMKGLPYARWLGEYRDHVNNLKLRKTAVHGDLQVRNILVDHRKSSVNVIDWDWRFQEKGNPLYDFLWFTANIMMLSNNMIDEFRSNLNGTGKAVRSVEIIKKTMRQHFQADLDFVKLLRFIILRFITIKIKEGNTGYLPYIELLKILSKGES